MAVLDEPRFYKQIKHETVHVVQFLLGILPNPQNRSQEADRWFNEGRAEYISSGFFIPITNKSQFSTWINNKDHINAISIHKWIDLPIPSSRVGEYYPMFGVALKYLLDKKGLGKSLKDVKQMFYAMADQEFDFAAAFELHFGISLVEYEAAFFARMENFGIK